MRTGELQAFERVEAEDGSWQGYRLTGAAGGSGLMPVISNAKTLAEVKQCFPYLCGTPEWVEAAPPGVFARKVAALEFQTVEDNAQLELHGLPIRLFPVYHVRNPHAIMIGLHMIGSSLA